MAASEVTEHKQQRAGRSPQLDRLDWLRAVVHLFNDTELQPPASDLIKLTEYVRTGVCRTDRET
jgi:predicted component of type VI protein secretion system